MKTCKSGNLTWPLDQNRSESRGGSVGCPTVPVAIPRDPKAAVALPAWRRLALGHGCPSACHGWLLRAPHLETPPHSLLRGRPSACRAPVSRVQTWGQARKRLRRAAVWPEAGVCWRARALGGSRPGAARPADCEAGRRPGRGGKGSRWGGDPSVTSAASVLSHGLWGAGNPESPVSSSLQDSIKLSSDSSISFS